MTSSGPARSAGWSSLVRTWWFWAVVALLLVVAIALAARAAGTGSTASASPSATVASSEPAPSPSESAPSTQTPTPDPASAPPSASAGATAGPGPTPRTTKAPVPLASAAAPAKDLRVELAKIEAVTGVANIPGEVGGPSLRVTVRVDNQTGAAVDLTSAVVNLYFGADAQPAITLLEPGARPFPSQVAAGASADAVVVFLVPEDQRGTVTVEFDLSSSTPVVLFTGAVTG